MRSVNFETTGHLIETGHMNLWSTNVSRLVDPEHRVWASKRVAEWSKEQSWPESPQRLELERLTEFLATVKDAGDADDSIRLQPSGTLRHDRNKHNAIDSIDWTVVDDLNDVTNTTEIEAALREISSQLSADDSRWFSRDVTQEFFRRLRTRVSQDAFVRHLDAIAQIDRTLITFYDFETVAGECLAEWDFHMGVRSWRLGLAGILALRWFDAFWFDQRFGTWTFNKTTEVLGLSAEDLLDAILRRIPEHLANVHASGLYELATVVVDQIPPSDLFEILEFVITDVRSQIGTTEIVTRNLLDDIEGASDDIESAMLWYLFGHPDKRIRWQAMHVARASLRLGNESLLSGLG